jgi:hypothetical protein
VSLVGYEPRPGRRPMGATRRTFGMLREGERPTLNRYCTPAKAGYSPDCRYCGNQTQKSKISPSGQGMAFKHALSMVAKSLF